MKFDVYCDESRPDLLTSKRPEASFAVIGSIWLPSDRRRAFKQAIHGLRDRHKVGGEFKWSKISPSRQKFYFDLIDWFANQNDDLRFRCIAVRHDQINWRLHDGDQELGFYKFYYQLLHHWISNFNSYAVFCDFKQNRVHDRLQTLRRCLGCSNLTSEVLSVQSVRSEESVLIQLADVLTGMASARLNDVACSYTKESCLRRLEGALGRRIGPTGPYEHKFNVFQIKLGGGW